MSELAIDNDGGEMTMQRERVSSLQIIISTHISFLEHFYIEADGRHGFDWLSMGKDR